MTDPKAQDGDKRTLVEEGTELRGSLSSKCPVLVRGRIEGEVAAPSLTVSTTGAVHGRAKVGEIKSQGELSGEFDADSIQLSGAVRDGTIIRAKTLEVKLAPANGKMQVVFGECSLDVGDAPGKADDVSKDGGKSKKASKNSVAPPALEKEAATEGSGIPQT
jgi:cytoskeletal protein CcmA (bactofilin family)